MTLKIRSDSIWADLAHSAFVLKTRNSGVSWKKAGSALYISVFHAVFNFYF